MTTSTDQGVFSGGFSPAERRTYRVLWLAVAAILCVPVWLPHLPPLSDYYNHLARLYIMSHYDSVPAYRQFYVVDWAANPNLALEIVGLPLLSVFSLATVAKIFLTLTILLWHAGCYLLGRAVHGRPTWRALICSFFVYNQQFLHGYVNFLFSMGLALVALAYWLENRRRLTAVRVLILALLATAVYFSHLSGFATLGIAVALMTLSDAVKRRGITAAMALGVLPLVPGTALFAFAFLGRAGGGGVSFPPIAYNVRDSLSLLTGYDQRVDVASMALVAVLVAIVLWRRRSIAAKSDLAVAGVGLGVIYWLCPSDVGAGLEVNVRFILGAITLLAFAVDVSVTTATRRWVLAAAMALFVLRTATTAGYWVVLDREFQDHVAAFEKIEEGAAVHNIYFHPAPRFLNARRVRGLALIHSPCFAAVHRHANVPTLYGIRGQQPLAHRVPLYRSHRFQDGQQPEIPWDEVFAHYRYVWTCRAPAGLIAPLAERGEVVAEAGACRLFEL